MGPFLGLGAGGPEQEGERKGRKGEGEEGREGGEEMEKFESEGFVSAYLLVCHLSLLPFSLRN